MHTVYKVCASHVNICMSTYIVNGLEVSSLNGERYYSLPDVYTQKTMPVSMTNIIQPEYLKKIPKIDGEVELLIATNASKMLEPWDAVNSQGDGPFATKTLLGWVVSGSCGDWKNSDDGCHSISINRVSVESLELLLEKQYEHDFNEKVAEDKQEMLREEARFTEIMEQSVKLHKGHYSLKFRTKEVSMANNRCVALHNVSQE